MSTCHPPKRFEPTGCLRADLNAQGPTGVWPATIPQTPTSPCDNKNAHGCGRLSYSFGNNHHQMRKESLVLVRTVPDET